MLRLACFALLVAVASAGKITFSNCGSAGSLVHLDVEDCNAAPCTLVKGRAYRIETAFIPRSASDSMVVSVDGKVSIITVPIITNRETCDGLSTGCPVQAGVATTHVISVNISPELIETNARVELRLKNQEGVVEACLSADVRITS